MIGVGDVVAGKYRVERVLGAGGMATVVAAEHLQLRQPVALKLMSRATNEAPAIVERFAREARASARLRGEHVCRVSDVGALEDGSPYMVMELLEGQDLANVIAMRGPLPVTVAIDYMLQACLGLAEAHALGVIHRDLKPANLFLADRPDGTSIVKVLDFGIAKAETEVAANLTQTRMILGSPGYMSPEQLRGSRETGVRSDIWSLGVVLYELVTGARPFDGVVMTEIALRVTLDEPPPLPPSIPRRFADVVMRCLEKDPARRFPHLGAFAAALAECGRPSAADQAVAIARMLNVPQRITAPTAAASAANLAVTVLPDAPMPTTLGSAASAVIAPAEPRHRRRWWVLGASGVAGAITAVAIGFATSPSSSPAPEALPDVIAPLSTSTDTSPSPRAASPRAIAGPPPSTPPAAKPASVQPAPSAGSGSSATSTPRPVAPPSTTPRPVAPPAPRPAATAPARPRPKEDLGASRF